LLEHRPLTNRMVAHARVGEVLTHRLLSDGSLPWRSVWRRVARWPVTPPLRSCPSGRNRCRATGPRAVAGATCCATGGPRRRRQRRRASVVPRGDFLEAAPRRQQRLGHGVIDEIIRQTAAAEAADRSVVAPVQLREHGVRRGAPPVAHDKLLPGSLHRLRNISPVTGSASRACLLPATGVAVERLLGRPRPGPERSAPSRPSVRRFTALFRSDDRLR
jgi:hypothetical protein